MAWLKLILGLWVLAGQGMFYFMLVAFSMPGTGGSPALNKFLGISFFSLITVCVVAAVLLIVGWARHWPLVYLWILFPVPFAVLFFFLRFKISW